MTLGKKGTGKPKKHYEEFFIEQGVMQYFIKPMKFKGNKNYLTIDFTFRDTLKYESFVIANYSIFTKTAVKKIDSTFFIINNEKIKFKNCERMFIDFRKDYQIRNTCNITYKELTKIVEMKPEIWAYFDNEKHVFVPSKHALKSFEVIKTRIIDIIELNRN